MLTYKTNQQNIKRYLFYQVLSILCLILVLFVCHFAFPKYHILKPSSFWIIGIASFIGLIVELNRERVFEISFNHDRQEMIFTYKSHMFSKLKNYTLQYQIAKVEKNEDTSFIKWLKKPLTIYFYKNKTEVFKESKKKDGFSGNVLNEIYKTCEQISLETKHT